ncbi:MAG: ATP synthase F1 subunit delta [Coriobacteriales bacterium]|jgi:F-type H+-transporting ATPase subunit delta|nr:ATP synthase F1 subunit delta [Coriobacteriales bacterium]
MPTDRTVIKKESTTYAEALLDAAKAQDNVFEVCGQLELVRDTVRGSIELRNTLTDHALDAEARKAIAREVFTGLDPALLAVLDVMIDRDGLSLLARVSESFAYLAEDALGAAFIEVTTVIPLDDALRAGITAKYSAQLGRGVLLREHVDPSIVGGIVLSTHGRRIDASVVSQLENARAVLSTVSSGGDR